MEIRESRNQDREFLAQAKTVFKDQTGMNPKEYRNVITRIKNELAKGQNAKLIVKTTSQIPETPDNNWPASRERLPKPDDPELIKLLSLREWTEYGLHSPTIVLNFIHFYA